MTVSALDWGRPLLVIAIGFGVWRVARAGLAAMPARLWALVAGQLVFWSLTGLNAAFFGQATSGRYQLLGVVFWVMIAAELLRGVPSAAGSSPWSSPSRCWRRSPTSRCSTRPRAGSPGSPRSSAAGSLRSSWRGRRSTRRSCSPRRTRRRLPRALDAGSYFSAIDAHGSPAYTPDELAGASDRARMSADKVFAAALGIGLEPVPASTTRACGPAPSPGSQPVPVRRAAP